MPLVIAAGQPIRQPTLPYLPQHQRAGAVERLDLLEVPAVVAGRAEPPELAEQPAAALLVDQQDPRSEQRDARIAFALPCGFGRVFCHGRTILSRGRGGRSAIRCDIERAGSVEAVADARRVRLRPGSAKAPCQARITRRSRKMNRCIANQGGITMSSPVIRASRALFGAAMLLLVAQAWAATRVPTVRIDSGRLSGIRDAAPGLDEFRGIPFAAPPVGALRWKPPQPVAPWKDVRRADHFGPRCMQRPLFSDMVFRSDAVSEDCLYLNVWMPAGPHGGKLPVLVYFYGGGFVGGDGSELRYDGASLARRGIVTVTVNYRLDVFGFLALPALAKESLHHATGNYGLLDQVAALRWVHRNIAAFGGDPSRVTVFGQSSGSISISALSVSPLTKGLFRYAIGESGGLFEPMQLASNLTAKGAQQDGVAFMRRADASSLAALREMPASALLKVPFTPGIILDGEV